MIDLTGLSNSNSTSKLVRHSLSTSKAEEIVLPSNITHKMHTAIKL